MSICNLQYIPDLQPCLYNTHPYHTSNKWLLYFLLSLCIVSFSYCVEFGKNSQDGPFLYCCIFLCICEFLMVWDLNVWPSIHKARIFTSVPQLCIFIYVTVDTCKAICGGNDGFDLIIYLLYNYYLIFRLFFSYSDFTVWLFLPCWPLQKFLTLV